MLKRYRGAFTGCYVCNPLNDELVPLYIADYVLAGYGTGAVMAVPSGDQRDYLFAKYFHLNIIPILDTQDITTEADPTKEGKYINSDFINGLTYKEATAGVIAKLEALSAGKAKINFRMRDAIFGRQRYWGEPVPVYFKNELPHLISEEDLPLVLPEVDKYLPTESGEPPLGRAENWKHAEGEYELSTMPGWAGSSWYWYRYMDAHNNKEFASRQAIEYWKDVDLYIGGSEHATGHLLYSRFWNKFLKDLGLVVEEEPFKKLINQGMIQGISYYLVVREVQEFDREYDFTKNEAPHQVELVGEGKFFMSFDRPKGKTFEHYGKHYAFAPTETASRISIEYVDNFGRLFRDKFEELVKDTRFFIPGTKFDFDKDVVWDYENGKPFIKLQPEVEKMSKSKWNVVNPDDLIARYGADTLRMYEMFLGPLEQSKPWNTNGIEGVFKFLRKFWRLFHNDAWEFKVSDAEPTKAELKSLHKIIRKVEEDIERFSFNTSVSSFMIAINELTDLKCNNRAVLQDLVVVLSSYAPHICEELWVLLGNEAGTLSYAAYPKFNSSYLIEDEFAYPISINGKTKMNLNISLSLEPKEIEDFVLANADVQRYLEGKAPKKVIVVKGRIVNMVV